MYVYVYVCVCDCVCVYIYIYIYIYIFIYLFIEVQRGRVIQTAGNTKTMHALYHFANGLASNEGQRLARFKWTGIFFEYYENIVKHIMKYNRTSIWSHPVSLYVYHIMILVYFTVRSTSSGSAFVIVPILGAKTIFESISLWSQILPLYFLIRFTDLDPPYFCTI